MKHRYKLCNIEIPFIYIQLVMTFDNNNDNILFDHNIHIEITIYNSLHNAMAVLS